MRFRNIFFIAILFLCIAAVNSAAQEPSPFFVGEKITYVIKNFGIKAGEATLVFKGPLADKTFLIVFRAESFNFLDEEKIFVNPETFLPVKVQRDLNIFGKKEKITEYYDPQKGVVRVVKVSGGKTTEQVIKKKGDLDNIYSFIYRYRRDGKFRIGDTLTMNLPTKDVEIGMLKKSKLKAAGKKFDAFFMQSNPKKYKVWFDSSDQRIPLRIDGSIGFGNTSMVMLTRYLGED